ncbi:MAG: MOSC domain-containing protein, partial [Lutibacter sp.]
MKVISVNLGELKVINYKGKIVETGIFKYPVNQPVFLGTEVVKNDAIIDRKHHGGIEKAVYGYSENHYEYWKELHPNLDWDYGMLGENLTISNLEETEIFVGNTYKLGEAL